MKLIIHIMKSIAVAFSMYSRIPMPSFTWNSEDMRDHLAFFPMVGIVIGLLEYGWLRICYTQQFPQLTMICVMIAVPLLVTGGFHVDGFMDTCDAMSSYRERDKRLEILKDPHIGAFSVICLLIYVLILAAGLAMYDTHANIAVFAGIFCLARILSALGVTYLKKAKKDGMLHTEAETEEKTTVSVLLWIELLMIGAFMIVCGGITGAAAVFAQILVFAYYVQMSNKHFGGITGDLAGYFVCLAELVSTLVIAAAARL